ncbi:MAG: hypothetical protein AAGJ50_05365, partial [Pseudomonadota bacterium]
PLRCAARWDAALRAEGSVFVFPGLLRSPWDAAPRAEGSVLLGREGGSGSRIFAGANSGMTAEGLGPLFGVIPGEAQRRPGTQAQTNGGYRQSPQPAKRRSIARQSRSGEQI